MICAAPRRARISRARAPARAARNSQPMLLVINVPVATVAEKENRAGHPQGRSIREVLSAIAAASQMPKGMADALSEAPPRGNRRGEARLHHYCRCWNCRRRRRRFDDYEGERFPSTRAHLIDGQGTPLHHVLSSRQRRQRDAHLRSGRRASIHGYRDILAAGRQGQDREPYALVETQSQRFRRRPAAAHPAAGMLLCNFRMREHRTREDHARHRDCQ